MASAVGTRDLWAKILLRSNLPVDSALDEALAFWSERYNQTGVMLPAGDAAAKQRN